VKQIHFVAALGGPSADVLSVLLPKATQPAARNTPPREARSSSHFRRQPKQWAERIIRSIDFRSSGSDDKRWPKA